MKKALILAAAALFLSAPVAFSQTKVKVDEGSFLKKIEKSDADIANAKKAASSATWLNRGKLFYDAETVISNNLFDNMPEVTATIMFGQPQREEVVLGSNGPHTKLTYPYFIAYADPSGGIRAWEITYNIVEGAIEKSIEAYNKAYELDAKTAPKVAEGLKANYDLLYKSGSVYFFLGDYAQAGEYFEKAYEVTKYPAFGESESDESIAALTHDAGVAYLFAPDYQKSYRYLELAEQKGYYRDGDIYYLMYHALKGTAPNNERDVLEKAKNILITGLGKFPNNANIIECITDVYVALGEDPKDVVPIVENAIASDPENVSLWNGLGRIYESLNETDKSIDAFKHVAQLMPDNFSAHYSVGILYLRKGDVENEEVNKDSSISTQAQYDAAMEKVLATYRSSVAPLETAYELAPKNDEMVPLIVELLKNVTFRLREDPGMMEKYEKYNELHKQFNQ